MQTVNMHEAKSNLSKLVELVLEGKDIVIARAGTPVVKLTKYTQPARDRTPGMLKGKIHISDDFDEEDERILKQFYGT